jgi:hypothetical protein
MYGIGKHSRKRETMANIDKLLDEKREHYGEYKDFNKDMCEILNLLKERKGEPRMITPMDVDNFFLVLKLLRSQTSEDLDSLIDLQGYAKIIKERRENAIK